MTLARMLWALFPGTMQAQFDAGYRAAVDRILLLPEKVRLGNTLANDADVKDCSFIGGSPAIQVMGERHRIENVSISNSEVGIQLGEITSASKVIDTIRLSGTSRHMDDA